MIKLTRRDYKILLALAIPLVLTGLVESSLGFSSTFFLAQLGPADMAAGSLVAWFFATLMVVLWGCYMGISTLISRYDGAKDHTSIALVIRDSLWLSALLVIPVGIIIWNLSPVLQLFGQKAELVNRAVPYMHALAWSVLPDFAGLALMQLMVGLGHMRSNLVYSLLWVPLNMFFNYALIFGKFGFPALGIAGLGWGTTAAYWVASIGLMVYMILRPHYKRYFWALKTFTAPKYMWELIKVGLPMGLMWFVEVGFFFNLQLFMGNISIDALAANQVVIQFMGVFVSVVFSLAQAITVRMGNKLGAGRPKVAHRAAIAGITITFGFVFLVSCVEWFAPHWLIDIDFFSSQSRNPQIVQYAVQFFAVITVFQLLEAIRISLFGALRAHKDTRFTFITSLISFWIVAIPLGYGLSKVLGPVGFWWGAAFSGLVSNALLIWRYRNISRRGVVISSSL